MGPVKRDASGRVTWHQIGDRTCEGVGLRVVTLRKTERVFEVCGVCDLELRLRQKNPVLPRHHDRFGWWCPASGKRAAVLRPVRVVVSEPQRVRVKRDLPVVREVLRPTPVNGPKHVRFVRGGLPTLGRR